ncbi:zinc metallopeptidase [Olsenella uli]|uniref:zinc metallopeptidase n=1 Tax=Olsenella uli TaxID=133926 RepID=UPI0012AC41AA|nr:zinc metallopeptidase [Olsenella uli]
MYYGYGYGWGFDPAYLLLVIVSTVLGLATQSYIKSTYATWSRVPLGTSLTGADVARRMLSSEGVSGVSIEPIAGELTDNFDPTGNVLHLSSGNLRGGSVASAAVACHEAGHAVQHARGYVPGRIRSALVPVVNFASNAWMLVFFAGVFMGLTGLVQLAVLLFAFSVLFQIVTLPVEFDASRRAVAYIERSGLGPEAVRGAKKVLTAAALTYVAAALVSILQLLYYLSRTQRRDD